MGWSSQRATLRLRFSWRLANQRLGSLTANLRRHPLVISMPLAVAAIGIGIAAQALLRPGSSSSNSDLLDALIAQPRLDPPAAASTSKRPPDPPSNPASATATLMAQRGPGGGLPDPAPGSALNLEIRVALLKASPHPELSASAPWQLKDRQGQVLQRGLAGERIEVGAPLNSLAEVWLETEPSGTLSVDGQAYEGRLRVLRGSNGLQLINHLPLESYISSVVGAEMPSSWNIEALRAQAVAARSYALAHMARPADPHWHLGDTTRWQAYSGLSSVSDRSRQATASTAGVILSYQGGIVESLYAATQGIVDEAHAHLGASMSQTGAQDLAQQGLRFADILGRYYRGATLARLQAGAH
ncbi:MAG: SpoIID/LytB domain-containing protein [Cyanobium sp.]